ncbi:GNAT family N-acetyltransferase [Moorena sp. SIO3B2]|uniref:GNAT family N-acetyltransferase n=1 Tax=Moorena sp. SIO3B2 TaxID=2607827 RepID=UPI0013C5F1EF|nr:GNAT family N-acetyltransferase [Moorena sp. SIO3B2]NEP34047.1 GNAT family N-acetyltransferase [Moorena sp. SIO3B2]
MYELTRIDKFGQAFFYQPLTFPLFRTKMRTLTPEGSMVAIGASYLNKPVGLVLAEILPDYNCTKILSIFVLPSHRRQGVGTALLSFLERELVVRGCTKAELFCELYDFKIQSKIFPLEALLQKCNWRLSNIELVYRSDLVKIFQASFMKKTKLLPSDMQIFSWEDITYKERLIIEQTQMDKSWIKETLYPFKYEENFEPLNSLGLRYRGEVVGWMLTERVAVDSILYNCMFVRKDLQKMGRAIALLIEAIKRQNKANIPNCIWEVNHKNTLMIRFIDRYMLPCLTSRGEIRLFEKSFC